MDQYESIDAIWYDNYTASGWGTEDIDFYVNSAVESKGKVLELGCGTGRILIPTAQAGVNIAGLDLSKDMINVCQRKIEMLPLRQKESIKLSVGNMKDFNFTDKFELITIPFRAFLHLMTINDQMSALNCIYRHLTDSGKLIMNIFDPNLKIIAEHMSYLGAALKGRPGFKHPESQREVIEWESREYKLEDQTISEMRIYDEISDDGRVINRQYIPLKLRFIYRYEMQHLLERCNFEILDLWGDFRKGLFKAGGEQIWVCRKRN